jgi:hypothetical protein
MRLVHDHRTAPSLPEMGGTAAARVDDAGVAPVHGRERAAQAIIVRGNEHEMRVVRHEAPGPHRDAGRAAMRAEQVAIERTIGVGEQGASTAVAALGDMARVAGNDEAGETGQAASSPISAIMSIECTVTVISTASIECTVTVIPQFCHRNLRGSAKRSRFFALALVLIGEPDPLRLDLGLGKRSASLDELCCGYRGPRRPRTGPLSA